MKMKKLKTWILSLFIFMVIWICTVGSFIYLLVDKFERRKEDWEEM